MDSSDNSPPPGISRTQTPRTLHMTSPGQGKDKGGIKGVNINHSHGTHPTPKTAEDRALSSKILTQEQFCVTPGIAGHSHDSDDSSDFGELDYDEMPHPAILVSWLRGYSENGLQGIDKRPPFKDFDTADNEGVSRRESVQDGSHCIPYSCNFQSANELDKGNAHCSKQHKSDRGDWERWMEPHSTNPSESTQPVSTRSRCFSVKDNPPQPKSLKTDKIHQTRARTQAEKVTKPAWDLDATHHYFCRARLYSGEEDGLLRNLVAQKLSWNKIEGVFSHHFPGRSSGSLQMRWSRYLRFDLPSRSTRRSERKIGLRILRVDADICAYTYRIFPGGWGFPISAAAAFMRALRLRLTE